MFHFFCKQKARRQTFQHEQWTVFDMTAYIYASAYPTLLLCLHTIQNKSALKSKCFVFQFLSWLTAQGK